MGKKSVIKCIDWFLSTIKKGEKKKNPKNKTTNSSCVVYNKNLFSTLNIQDIQEIDVDSFLPVVDTWNR